VKKSKIKCEDETETRRVRNKVSIENSASLEQELNYGRINKFLSWEFEVWTCEGEHKFIPVSINLSDFANEGINDLIDQTFEASEFKLVEGSVKNEEISNIPRIIINPNIAPKRISGPRETYVGEEITLRAEGGFASPEAKYVWTKDGCEGEVILESETNELTITVESGKTNYFVHISNGPTENTKCATFEINGLNKSAKAENIKAPNYVCDNQKKQITLEVEGGKLGEGPNGEKAEWVWRIDNGYSIKIMRGKSITVDQPISKTTYSVNPEGFNKVESISHTIDVLSPSSLNYAFISSSSSRICQGQSVQLELKGGSLAKDAIVTWQETNYEKYKSYVSNYKAINIRPNTSTTYGVYVSDKCTITPELTTTVTVIASSELPEFIEIDSSKRGRMVTLNIEDQINGKSRLNSNSKWVWYSPNITPEYDSQGLPLQSHIINTGSTSITLKAKKPILVSLKAFGECEINEYVSVSVPRKIDKYFFMTLGSSSNDINNLSTRVFTLGSNRVYFRTKQSLNAALLGDNKTNTYIANGNLIKNFPANTGLYYTFNKEKAVIRSSYTMGFFLNENDVKFYLGGGIGSVEYYSGVDILAYKNNIAPTKSWAKSEVNSVNGAEIEAGISIKLKPFYLMGGVSYTRGTEMLKGYIAADLNIGIAF
jgi:hypothetical protein